MPNLKDLTTEELYAYIIKNVDAETILDNVKHCANWYTYDEERAFLLACCGEDLE